MFCVLTEPLVTVTSSSSLLRHSPPLGFPPTSLDVPSQSPSGFFLKCHSSSLCPDIFPVALPLRAPAATPMGMPKWTPPFPCCPFPTSCAPSPPGVPQTPPKLINCCPLTPPRPTPIPCPMSNKVSLLVPPAPKPGSQSRIFTHSHGLHSGRHWDL